MTTKVKAPSIWLRLVAFYFKIGGVIFAVIAVLGLVSGFALDWAPGTTQAMPMPLTVAIVCAMAVSLLATGILLARRLRAGAVLGLVLTLYPSAFALVQRRTMDCRGGIIAVPTIVLLSVCGSLNGGTFQGREPPLTDQQ